MTKSISTIAVLAGGISHERDVSLRSGRKVADLLKQHGIKVELIDPDQNFFEAIAKLNPQVVWPVLHGASGEDGTLSELLELAGIPFVGSPGASARLAWNKPTAKALVAREGINTPQSLTITREVFRELGASSVLKLILEQFELPLVVKPAQGGSAQGVTLVTESDSLARAMIDAYTYHDVALVERQITGVEVSVGIIDTGDGPVSLPLVEVVPKSGVYSFEARYNAGETDFFTPARIDTEIAQKAAQTAVLAHQILGLRHLSRVDLIIDEDGTIWFLEANILPGLTETSLLPLALESAGHDLGWVYSALASAALVSAKSK